LGVTQETFIANAETDLLAEIGGSPARGGTKGQSTRSVRRKIRTERRRTIGKAATNGQHLSRTQGPKSGKNKKKAPCHGFRYLIKDSP